MPCDIYMPLYAKMFLWWFHAQIFNDHQGIHANFQTFNTRLKAKFKHGISKKKKKKKKSKIQKNPLKSTK